MRVATYSQPATATRGSLFAWFVLVLTVLVGTSALHTLALHFVPQIGVVTSSILWLLLYLLSFLGLMFSQGINWISWMVRYRILLVIVLLGTIASVGWSVEPGLSAERTVHLLGCSVIAVYLGFMVPLLTILRISAGALSFVMVGSLLAAVAMPDLGIENYEGQLVWKGIVSSKNSLGFWSAISVLLLITLSDSVNTFVMRLVCYLFALVALIVLVMSDSATSLLGMVVAGSLSLYLYIAFRFQLGFARMAVMALLFIGLIGLVITNINTAEMLGRSGDLTGRGEVWAQTWRLIMQRPLTGYGYGALWFPNDETLWIQQRFTDFTWVVYHAHNGFLQIASEIGLPLSVIALLMVVQQLIEIFYCQYQRQQAGVLFVLAFVVTFLISNVSEARFLVNRELYWIFFLALPISMLRQISLVSGNPYAWDEGDEEPSRSGVHKKPRDWDSEADDLDRNAVAPSRAGASASIAGEGNKPWLAEPSTAQKTSGDNDDSGRSDSDNDTKFTNTDVEDEADQSGFFEHHDDFEQHDSDVVRDDLVVSDDADIDLGEIISEEVYQSEQDDPHDRLIHPEDDDMAGLDDNFDDDDQYDRFVDEDDDDNDTK